MQTDLSIKKKKRILVPIVGQGSIIHIIRTGMLQKLSEFCEPVVCFLWDQPDLMEELRGKGYDVHLMPAYNVSNAYSDLKSKIDFWYTRYRVKTPSVNIQKKYTGQFKKRTAYSYKKKLKEIILQARLSAPGNYIKRLIDREAILIKQQPVFNNYKKWINNLDIEGLFTVTPFLHEVDLIARILREDNKKIIASIHSFDNVTKRGWASTFFDHYIVWNNYNKKELERIHPPLKQNNAITIAGAPQFDFHFNENFCWTKDEWLNKLNLPAGKKIILYAGGPASLLPDEPQYLKHLDEAFKSGEISDDNIILFRCHPLDKKERWIKHVGESKHIYFDEAPHGQTKLDYVNVVEEDIKNLMSTLKYSDVHINVVSTMSVDGSAFNKPQIGPYYDRIKSRNEELFRKMYCQEHYVPIMKSGVVNLAHDKKQYIDIINKTLANPAKFTNSCEKCITEIITYTDGHSANRAVAAIKNFLQ